MKNKPINTRAEVYAAWVKRIIEAMGNDEYVTVTIAVTDKVGTHLSEGKISELEELDKAGCNG